MCLFYETMVNGYQQYHSIKDESKVMGFSKSGRPLKYSNKTKTQKTDENCYNIFKWIPGQEEKENYSNINNKNSSNKSNKFKNSSNSDDKNNHNNNNLNSSINNNNNKKSNKLHKDRNKNLSGNRLRHPNGRQRNNNSSSTEVMSNNNNNNSNGSLQNESSNLNVNRFRSSSNSNNNVNINKNTHSIRSNERNRDKLLSHNNQNCNDMKDNCNDMNNSNSNNSKHNLNKSLTATNSKSEERKKTLENFNLLRHHKSINTNVSEERSKPYSSHQNAAAYPPHTKRSNHRSKFMTYAQIHHLSPDTHAKYISKQGSSEKKTRKHLNNTTVTNNAAI